MLASWVKFLQFGFLPKSNTLKDAVSFNLNYDCRIAALCPYIDQPKGTPFPRLYRRGHIPSILSKLRNLRSDSHSTNHNHYRSFNASAVTQKCTHPSDASLHWDSTIIREASRRVSYETSCNNFRSVSILDQDNPTK